ncbi:MULTISPECIES: type II toxin-antitoxin system VapC family toxin [Moraxella]|uniref:PIN domain-containing protein n=1 Tax=Moraxella lacunata TaxID=477 RepID=A0A1B8PZ47_MORLA|nr:MULTISPECIES: PIN domain-containing protein [Moraxella]MBE9588550.1 PIN domain-containing protein [Moraxella sp. K1630]MBE9589893.1 PIN domain-containing protein [Moraxella sp. K127]MBE9596666.1 PIN domain-containing protein [Moraxella sp. K2450]MDH9219339.1 PIN domain-containing protein [Moraxella lacunata]MDI4483190.1 PIN domain-containing protein [Moraxella lacunata]
MAKILIDSGIFVALFDKSDKYHQQSVQFIKDNKKPLITSLACVTEAMFLLAHPRPQNALLNFLHLARIEIAEFSHKDMPALADLMSQYSNVPMDFADACLVHLAQRETLSHIATIDSDFRIYRIHGYPFRVMI